MTGASLGYSGVYTSTQLNEVGNYGNWQSSTVHQESVYAYNLQTRTIDTVRPRNRSTKYGGRSVRCAPNLVYQFGDATQGDPVALIIGACLNQA